MAPTLCWSKNANPHSAFQADLRSRLRSAAEPLIAHEAQLVPAASLWVMLRRALTEMREGSSSSPVLIPDKASVDALASLLAALWLGGDLLVGGRLLTFNAFIYQLGSVNSGYVRAAGSVMNAAPNDPLYPQEPKILTVGDDWGDVNVLCQQVIPALFAAEVVVLGSCSAQVWQAIQACDGYN